MCILIAKPKNVKMPSEETMKNCWESNPDGAGIAWSDGHKLFLRKGFMKWNDFIKEYRTLNLNNFDAIIHFRIATHGTVKPSNTHPFNVSDRIVAGHNGILPITPEGDWTDSETFFKRVASPILETYSLDSLVFEQAVNAVIGTSKLAFLTDSSKLKTFGKFIIEDGVMYSNTTFMGYGKSRKKSKKRGKSSYSFNDYELGWYDDYPYYESEYSDFKEDEDLYDDLTYSMYVYMEGFMIEFNDFEGAVSYIDVKNYIYSMDRFKKISTEIFDCAYDECLDAMSYQYGSAI